MIGMNLDRDGVLALGYLRRDLGTTEIKKRAG
jgi:hypothetical protein